MSAWIDHVIRWKDCTACPLCQQRDNIVLARAGVVGGVITGGQIPCEVVFIGEAPGASEDATGLPFWGPAGDLLQQIIERAMPPTMRYAMTNLVACFPAEAKSRGENEPEHGEILSCRMRLIEFVNIAQPRLIVCVGSLAAQYVDHKDSVPCADIIHPAAILRMPLAQKQMAVQRVIVTLRNTVDDMLQSNHRPEFTKWGNHASIKPQTPRERLRADYAATIPF